MVVDAFIFYNELDMLEFRLEELNEHVDYFVLVEAPLTFSGISKPLVFQENKDRFQKFLHKIIHLVVDDIPKEVSPELSEEEFYRILNTHGENPDECLEDSKWKDWFLSFKRIHNKHWHAWVRECYQRAAILTGIKQINLSDSDIVLISDMDEIVDTDLLVRIQKNEFIKDPHIPFEGPISDLFAIYQAFFYYNLECRYAHWNSGMRIMNYGTLKRVGNANAVRFLPVNSIGPGGWHFDYFGEVDWIVDKIKSFAHQELNTPENLDKKTIETRIANSIDLYGRDQGVVGSHFSFVKFSPTDYWPKKVELLIKLFKFNYNL